MKIPDSQIAITLFNLRDYCQTAEDFDKTLGKLKDIGFKAVQISCIGPIEPAEVKRILDKNEMFCCATHEGLAGLRNNFEDIVAKMKLWECDFTALGYPGDDCWSLEGMLALAKELDEIGGKFKAEGLKLGFHNHHYEFVKYTNKTFLDELYDRAPNLYGELDTYHTVGGGGDPVQWIHKLEGRMPVCHFKDFSIIDREPVSCEVGEGNLNWAPIIQACKDTNVRWYTIEQDDPLPHRDIWDSTELSYKNLTAMGVK